MFRRTKDLMGSVTHRAAKHATEIKDNHYGASSVFRVPVKCNGACFYCTVWGHLSLMLGL